MYGTVPIRIAPVNNSPVTVLAKNYLPRTADPTPYGGFNHAVAGETLFFTAYDPTHGIELWKYEQGTTSALLVKDIWPGSASSRPSDLYALNDKVYFNAWTPEFGLEAWVSDGTASGTRMIVDANVDGNSWAQFSAVGNSMFIAATNSDGDQVLYRTNGTPSGLTSISSNPFGLQYNSIQFIGVHLGALYFTGRLGDQAGIFRVTPKMSRSSEVLDLGASDPDVDEIERLGNRMIFFWESGDSVGFFAVDKSFGPRPVNLGVRNIDNGEFLGVVNNKLVFVLEEDADGSPETLWSTNGLRTGTTFLKDLDTTTEVDDNAEPLYVNVGGKLLFLGKTTRGGLELWVTDATAGGTKVLRELGVGPKDGIRFESTIKKVGASVFFEAPNTLGSIVLWRTDGTSTGTKIVANGISKVRVVDGFSDALIFAGVKDGNEPRLYLQPLAS